MSEGGWGGGYSETPMCNANISFAGRAAFFFFPYYGLIIWRTKSMFEHQMENCTAMATQKIDSQLALNWPVLNMLENVSQAASIVDLRYELAI